MLYIDLNKFSISTTRMAMMLAICFWWRSPAGSPVICAIVTSWPAWAETNSWFCSTLGADPLHAQKHAQTVVDKIQSALEEPCVRDDIVHRGSASIGVKLIASGGDNDRDQVLNDADAAMYIVKKRRS